VSRAFTLFALVAPALVAPCCGGTPRVAPIQVRYQGPSQLPPVSPALVEVVRGPESRPYLAVAKLEIEDDGTTFEDLVHRLRERAGSIGANAIVEVAPMYDSPGPALPQTSSNDALNTGEANRDVMGVSASLLLRRPKFVGVKAMAVRIGDLDASLASDAPSAVSKPDRGAAPPPVPEAPATRPPEEKP